MVKIFSWGRLQAYEHHIRRLYSCKLSKADLQSPWPALCYGMGRSYGDVCLNPGGLLWETRDLDKFIAFDEQTGRLRCEAGVLLGDIQRLLLTRGWALAVTPGTQFVTVGGAIANDVHGKNFHVFGSFGNQLRAIQLQRTDGELLLCDSQNNPDWLAASIGGLGLTGIILTAELQLRPVQGPWLLAETIPYHNLQEFLDLSDASEADWEHTVSWIDCTQAKARGLFMRAKLAENQTLPVKEKRSLRFPFTPPFSCVNHWVLNAFNQLYFNLNSGKQKAALIYYEDFLYPLDKILDWNKMYGKKGFYQYQCLVPKGEGVAAVAAILDEISKANAGSFLTVLKTFSKQEARGLLSFPQEGITLALDFPNQGKKTLALLARLDKIVQEVKGRLYLAKDARMSAAMFEAGYPNLPEFLNYRDPGISSGMSRRLMGF